MLFCMGVKLGLSRGDKEHRLRVFGNRVLRIRGPKREEVEGSWRRLHNEEVNNCTLHKILLGRSSKGG